MKSFPKKLTFSDQVIQTFLQQPYAEQCSFIQQHLTHQNAKEMLELCASSGDYELVCYSSSLLLRQKKWTSMQNNWLNWFTEFLCAQPSITLMSWLQMLEELLKDPEIRLEIEFIQAILYQCAMEFSYKRLDAYCLFDKVLQQTFPKQGKKLYQACKETCQTQLNQDTLENIPLDALAKLPAHWLSTLHIPQKHEKDFAILHQNLIKELFHSRYLVPKTLSQAKAELLLSEKVYQSPGHFLYECLQNAEDQCASVWKVHFSPDRILFWHDGHTFDARDLVGITSIGLSTKSQNQIGLFGVGFKSVYEVTQRPQIYSGRYRFEIANFSMPRQLAETPKDLPKGFTAENGTLLVLPLTLEKQVQGASKTLFHKMTQLDPVILLILKNIRNIECTLDEQLSTPKKGNSSRTGYLRKKQANPSIAKIENLETSKEESYLYATEEVICPPQIKSLNQVRKTQLLVGLRCSPQGIPQPLQEDETTVYSFLPTSEHSGLHFFIQASFDLPINRERLAQSSAWNTYLLGKVPALLSQLYKRIKNTLPRNAQINFTKAFLELLPLKRELSNPLFAPIQSEPASLRSAFAEVACVPTTQNDLRPPTQCFQADPVLFALLHHMQQESSQYEELCFSSFPDRPHLAISNLSVHVIQLLKDWDCPELDLKMWLHPIHQQLEKHPNGEPPPEGMRWLFQKKILQPLLQHISAKLSSLEAMNDSSRFEEWLLLFSKLPFVPDTSGGLHRIPDTSVHQKKGRLRQARPLLKQVWKKGQPFVDTEVFEKAPTLFQNLQIPELTRQSLLLELEETFPFEHLDEEELTKLWPSEAPWSEQLSRLIELFQHASEQEQQRFTRLPIFPSRCGKYYPIAKSPMDSTGIVVAKTPSSKWHVWLIKKRPIATEEPLFPGFCRPPFFTTQHVIEFFCQSSKAFTFEEAEIIHQILAEQWQELSGNQVHSLAKAHIWPTTNETMNSLAGEGASYLYRYETLPKLFPRQSFVHKKYNWLIHTQLFQKAFWGPKHLIQSLLSSSEKSPTLNPSQDNIVHIQQTLRAMSDLLRSFPKEQLMELPVFVDQYGHFHKATELSLPPESKLRPLLALLRSHPFVGEEPPEQKELLESLGLVHVMPPLHSLSVLEKCFRSSEPLGEEEVKLLLPLLTDSSKELPYAILEKASLSKVFWDEDRQLGFLGDWESPDRAWHQSDTQLFRSPMYRCPDPKIRKILSAAGFRLLHEELEHSMATLMDCVHIRPADAQEVVQTYTDLQLNLQIDPQWPSPLLDAEYQTLAKQILQEQRNSLDEEHTPEVLQALLQFTGLEKASKP